MKKEIKKKKLNRKRTEFHISVPVELKTKIQDLLISHPPKFRAILEEFLLFCEQLYNAQVKKKYDEDYYKEKYTCIPKSLLKIFSIAKQTKIRKYLMKYGILESDGYFIQGVKPYFYRITEPYSKFTRTKVSEESKLYESMKRIESNKRSHVPRMIPHIKAMYSKFMAVDFDYEGMENWTNNYAEKRKVVYDEMSVDTEKDIKKKRIYLKKSLEKNFAYNIQIAHLQDKRLRYYGRNNNNHRVDTNLTALKSDLLMYMKGDYIELDIKNSQFYLLGMLIIQIIKEYNNDLLFEKGVEYRSGAVMQRNSVNGSTIKIHTIPFIPSVHLTKPAFDMFIPLVNIETITGCCDNYSLVCGNNFVSKSVVEILSSLPEDVQRFIIEVVYGTFYDNFGSYIVVDRSFVKNMMMKILFSKNKLFADFKDIFRLYYPNIMDFAHKAKIGYSDNAHKKLAKILQRMESFIFIDVIAKDLFEQGIIPFTKHDSLIVEKNNAVVAKQVMENAFANMFGVIPTISYKEYVKPYIKS